jgi:hypothetical protein
MSHNVLSVNDAEPNRTSEITKEGSLAISWRGVGTADLGLTAGGYTSGNIPFYRTGVYYSMTLGTGVTVTSSSQSVILPQYQSGWFDEVSLPQGEYILMHQHATYNMNGTFAWVNNSTNAKLGPIISTESNHNTINTRIRITAPSGGLLVGCRILSGNVSGASGPSLQAHHLHIIKI